MKPSESNIIDVECNDVNVKEIKKMAYRDLDIYAVKRSTDYTDAQCALLNITNTAWWCGYVEVPPAMYSLLMPKGYLDEEIPYRLADPDSYDLAVVHGGYTYIDYGIPHVLNHSQRLFLGWDYNHFCDTETCVTYNDIMNEGKRVIDSMLERVIKGESR